MTTIDTALDDIYQLHHRIVSADETEDFLISNPWEGVEQSFLYNLELEYGDTPTSDQIDRSMAASLEGLEAEARDFGIELDY